MRMKYETFPNLDDIRFSKSKWHRNIERKENGNEWNEQTLLIVIEIHNFFK